MIISKVSFQLIF